MWIEMHTTCSTREEAQRIAGKAVEQHLCAGVQIVEVESFYWWECAP